MVTALAVADGAGAVGDGGALTEGFSTAFVAAALIPDSGRGPWCVLQSRMPPAQTRSAAGFPSAIRGVHSVLGRRRFAISLVAVAALLTLGHLLGPQSDLHAISSHDHEVGQDHAAPSHDHGAHACGLAMLPDASADVPAANAADIILPDCADPIAPVTDAVDVRDRSPTDPVSELQVNRV